MKFLKDHDKKLINIKIEEITPSVDQPRKNFDSYELSKLTESIKQCGIIQPLTVRRSADGFILVAGERRLRAAKAAGLKRVPCIVTSLSVENAAFISIIENLQRTDLSLFEQAEGIQKLINEFGVTHCDAAERLGIAQSTLSNKLRILKLNAEERDRITAARLTERHARALIRLEGEERTMVLNRVIAQGMSVKECEDLVESIINPQNPEKIQEESKPTRKTGIADIRIFANSLTRLVDTLMLAGLDARQKKSEGKDYIEYRIRIKKQAAPPEAESPQLKIC